ncbi:MAG TPA: substrate-binding domain-containing protein [Terriglobales bacterium]|nr:substrate-binding domain-containing protein [Terriglobales bacterium]
MQYRRLALCALTISFLVPLLSCGNGHSGETYILIAANIKVPYWQSAGAGFAQAASQIGVAYIFQGPDNYDPNGERDSFDGAMQRKPAGVLVSVADPKAMKDSIDKAIAAGVPVITIDSDAPESKRLFFVGTNNYQAGMIGGKRLAQELKGKGNVVVYTMPSQPNLDERMRGYKAALESSPGIKITHIVDIKGDPRVAYDSTNQFLGNDKKEHIDAFVCLEALSGKEVASVLSSYNVKDKTIIAMDTDADTLQWIQKGVIAATISQKPYTMAYVGLQMLDTLHHHPPKTLDSDWAHDTLAPVPAFVDTGSALVDKSNVDSFLAATKSVSGK